MAEGGRDGQGSFMGASRFHPLGGLDTTPISRNPYHVAGGVVGCHSDLLYPRGFGARILRMEA